MNPVARLIEDKLDQFYTKTSPRCMDKTIWKEVFDMAEELESTNPNEYFYQIKRLRDLKATIDYAYEEGKRQGRLAGKRQAEFEVQVAKRMKKKGEPMEKIMKYTQLTKDEIEQL